MLNDDYSNQKNFPRVLSEVHAKFPGFHAEGIGAAVIDTRMGMRDKDGVVHTDT